MKQSSKPVQPQPLPSQSNKTNQKFVEPSIQSSQALLQDSNPLSQQSSTGKSNIIRNPDISIVEPSIIVGSKPFIANTTDDTEMEESTQLILPRSETQACKLKSEELLNKVFMGKKVFSTQHLEIGGLKNFWNSICLNLDSVFINSNTKFLTSPYKNWYMLDSGLKNFWNSICLNLDSVFINSNTKFLTSPYKNWYMLDSKNLYKRKCYTTHYESFKNLVSISNNTGHCAKMLHSGTSGVGKTAYLMFLLVSLIHDAHLENNRIEIILSQSIGGNTMNFLLKMDGTVSFCGHTSPADYHISDSVDITSFSHVSKGAVLVTSEKSSESTRFKKEGIRGFSYPGMELWSKDELTDIAYFEVSDALKKDTEIELRYSIFGGSARNFNAFVTNSIKLGGYEYISSTMDLLFHEEKKIIDPARWNGILSFIVTSLSSASNQEDGSLKNNLTSLMYHTNNGIVNVWASPFMKFLADQILDKKETSIKKALLEIVGASGLGCSFKYFGHEAFLTPGSTLYSGTKLERGRKKKAADLTGLIVTTNNLKLKRFRTIEDITDLPDNVYGLPFAPNFPLIDAIIQPNTLIQFCTGDSHNKAASDKLPEILKKLRGDPKDLKMIFVNDSNKFGFQSSIESIDQYILSYKNGQQVQDPTSIGSEIPFNVILRIPQSKPPIKRKKPESTSPPPESAEVENEELPKKRLVVLKKE